VDPKPRLRLLPSPAEPSAGEEASVPLDARSDDDLMLLARAGVEPAFEALVRRHQARMLRVAARYLGRVDLAPDAAQNAFIEIHRGLGRYQPRGRFSSFLYRVLLNQCRMARRSARAESAALDRAAREPADGATLSDEQILARERQRDLDQAVAGLSEKLRSVVLLRYTAGLDYARIAETLDVPLGTVKRRMFDALRILHEKMQEQP
jgi:RNA polymerase sigma-70 factor (ECF subfamily)